MKPTDRVIAQNVAPYAPRVALFGNCYQPEKSAAAAAVLSALQVLEADLWIEEEFAVFLQKHIGSLLPPHNIILCNQPVKADLALSLGGDGTFLRTASRVGASGAPILGINTGHLGFLADAMPDEAADVLQEWAEGRYTIEERSLIAVRAEGTPLQGSPFALNEVAVLKHDNSSLINILTHIGTDLLTDYAADGLIVSTPTGSTGYSLSTGGPIIAPVSHSFCLSAVAPHSLSIRPVIVNDDVEITLHVRSRTGSFLLSIDGRSETLAANTTIRLRRADHTVRVMKIRHPNFYDTLRAKMHWGTRFQ